MGVVAGAVIVEKAQKDIHWEACDDPREFSLQSPPVRALFMGAGGIMATGCTIGQGVSPFSVLAFTAPVALLGIFIGARFGLKLLLEGRPQFFGT